MPSNHASARSLARPLANSRSLIFCNSRVMSPGGSSPLEFLEASKLLVPDGEGSTSAPAGWHPFKVSLMASNERSMRASSSDGAGGAGGVGGGDGVGVVGGARVDAPLPRPLRVLAILYDFLHHPQNFLGEFKDVSIWCYLNLETRLGIIFLYLSVNRHYSIMGIGSVWVRFKHLSLVCSFLQKNYWFPRPVITLALCFTHHFLVHAPPV
jgi:hypothetical protein